MKKENISNLLPVITATLIFIRSFVLVIVLIVLFSSINANQKPVSQDLDPILVTPLPQATQQLSPVDAALANSEWSGARIIKTPVIEATPFVIPTRIPTAVLVQNSTTNNTAALIKPTNVLINSPLDGFSVGDLQELISQNFKAPPPGEDTGHHGVDFAFWSRGNKPILGVPILATFPGKVAMAGSEEKPPYGFALIIETPLDEISKNLIQAIKIPTQPMGTIINNKLNCPDLSKDQWNTTSKSLYTLYGHMIKAPTFKTGDSIQEGQTIGYVGNSGYSSAPHLHLEMRIGPSNATFINMGHYDPVTTEEDRHNYCNWRVSGVFQMFDPMDLFKASLALK
jgi:murein DD-endopeptidase MepM/ murein hydrolase activator NlpD